MGLLDQGLLQGRLWHSSARSRHTRKQAESLQENPRRAAVYPRQTHSVELRRGDHALSASPSRTDHAGRAHCACVVRGASGGNVVRVRDRNARSVARWVRPRGSGLRQTVRDQPMAFERQGPIRVGRNRISYGKATKCSEPQGSSTELHCDGIAMI